MPTGEMRGDNYEQSRYLKKVGRQREKLLRQFCKNDGPQGNSNSYVEGWERVFGKNRGK